MFDKICEVELISDLGSMQYSFANALVHVKETYTVWVRTKDIFSNSGLSKEEYLKHYGNK